MASFVFVHFIKGVVVSNVFVTNLLNEDLDLQGNNKDLFSPRYLSLVISYKVTG